VVVTVSDLIPVLVLSGPIGVGKSTLLGEIADLLREADEAFVAVDLDGLTQVFPRPPGDPHALGVGARNLATVWMNAAAAGARRMVLASVIETDYDLGVVLEAVPGANPFVVRLAADEATLFDRVRRREIGTARGWHLERSFALAEILRRAGLEDAVVQSDDRPIREIGLEILRVADWPVPD
jgi:hypothetical protein